MKMVIDPRFELDLTEKDMAIGMIIIAMTLGTVIAVVVGWPELCP
jgi:hypothetical protein